MIFVTGATGFIGQALVSQLALKNDVRISLRARKGKEQFSTVSSVFEKDLHAADDWSDALAGVNVIVHCAARAHVMNEHAKDPLAEFRRVNVDGTLQLAKQASEAGVKRFVFLSSIKVNGNETGLGIPFSADQPPNPKDPYGISKADAEEELGKLSVQTGMEIVVIRPPLVYGPGVKANFLAMMKWVFCGIPLPLGGITENRRSLVALDNLIDLIVTCVDHPAAANQTFLVSDDDDLSTTALLRRMGGALGRPARLFPVPVSLLRFGASILGRQEIAQRLCSSLQVDISKTKETLGWTPPISVDKGLRLAAQHLRDTRRGLTQ